MNMSILIRSAALLLGAVLNLPAAQAQSDFLTSGTAECFAYSPTRASQKMGSTEVSTLQSEGDVIFVYGPASPNHYYESSRARPSAPASAASAKRPLRRGSAARTASAAGTTDTGESAVIYGGGNPGEVLGFYGSSTPIKYAVAKSGDTVLVRYYGSGGTYEDYGISITHGESYAQIGTLNLCYDGPAGPPPPAATIPQCDPSQCTSAQPSMMCAVPLDQPFFGNGTDQCCVCNHAELPRCNPDALAGAQDACIPGGAGTKTNVETPTRLELNHDPYVCTVSGGVRTCYSYPPGK